MTREEARLYADNHMGIYGGRLVDEVVQTIFNDFESRTCENCKHRSVNYSGDCLNSEIQKMMRTSYIGYPTLSPPRDFGCNKWEAKDNK